MSDVKVIQEFEKYKLTVTTHEECSLQLVGDSSSGITKWQTWRRGRNLGDGTFGYVRQEASQDGYGDLHYRAVKVCSEGRLRAARIDYKRELSALAAFSRSECASWFVNLYGWWTEAGSLCIAMEYLGRGDLSRYTTEGIPELEIRDIAENLLRGLDFMHSKGFTHRDIKPQNILVVQKPPEFQRWWVKIADFGISKQILADSETALHTIVGTRPYCAPEILGYLNQNLDTSVYTSKVDMWSFGCVLFNLGSRGQLAFSEIDLVRYCDGKLQFDPKNCARYLSNGGNALVKALLQVKPDQRPSAAEVLCCPWFSTWEVRAPYRAIDLASEAQAHSSRNFNSFLDSSFSMKSPTNSDTSDLTPIPAPDANPEQTLETSQPVQGTVISRDLHIAQHPQIKAAERQAAVVQNRILNSNSAETPGSELGNLAAIQPESDFEIIQLRSGEDRDVRPESQESGSTSCTLFLLRREDDTAEMTLLHRAAYRGYLDVMKHLVEEGTDCFARNKCGFTPIQSAAQGGQLEVVKWLFEHGAKLDHKNRGWLTPLQVAAKEGHLEIVKWLFEHGADPHAMRETGETTLHLAAREGRLEVVKWLAEHDAKLNPRGWNRDTPLQLAVRHSHLEIVKWLVQHGADIDAKGGTYMPPVGLASSMGDLEAAKWLAEHGANIHRECWFNTTCLHLAADNGHLEVVKWLVEQGIDLRAKNDDGRTARRLAEKKGHVEVSRWLKVRERATEGPLWRRLLPPTLRKNREDSK